jgi:hypothetical protein
MGRDVHLSKLPPAVRESEFQAVEADNPEKIKQYYEPFIRELHSFLNSTSCIRNIQNVRRRWKQVPTKQRAFHDGSFNAVRRHWYTYNWGGRSEAQFNIGLVPEYLRVGLGFEFTGGQYGNIEAVQLAYRGFRSIIDRHQRAFDDFVRENQLRIEWNPVGQAERRHTSAGDETLKWLGRRPPKPPDWIFVGRLLDRREDAEILADPSRLMDVIESVFGGFLPFWEETQAEVNSVDPPAIERWSTR